MARDFDMTKARPILDLLPRPVDDCGHVGTDGCCAHPDADTPECHLDVRCPAKGGGGEIASICDDCPHPISADPTWVAILHGRKQ